MGQKNAQRFDVLDSWRGIAALIVAFGHLKTNGLLSTLPISSTSFRFVDFFFVLSGFVISFSSGDRLILGISEVKRFLIRRIVRLWPLHIFVLGLFLVHQIVLLAANLLEIVQEPIAFSEEFSPLYLLQNLLLVQAWETTPFPTWNKPAWSISTEMFAYGLFAFISVILRRFAKIAVLVVACVGLVAATITPDIMTATFTMAIARCCTGFACGVVVFHLFRTFQSVSLPYTTAIECVATLAILACVMFLPPAAGVLILPVCCVAVFIFALEQGGISSLLKRQVFAFLGTRSYSIYMIHPFVLLSLLSTAAVLGIVGSLPDGKAGLILHPILADAITIAYIAVVVAASHFTYCRIEVPSSDLLLRKTQLSDADK